MGRDLIELRAGAAVSRHNSPQDDADNAAWNAFVAAVEKAASESRLAIDVMADGSLPVNRWGGALRDSLEAAYLQAVQDEADDPWAEVAEVARNEKERAT